MEKSIKIHHRPSLQLQIICYCHPNVIKYRYMAAYANKLTLSHKNSGHSSDAVKIRLIASVQLTRENKTGKNHSTTSYARPIIYSVKYSWNYWNYMDKIKSVENKSVSYQMFTRGIAFAILPWLRRCCEKSYTCMHMHRSYNPCTTNHAMEHT